MPSTATPGAASPPRPAVARAERRATSGGRRRLPRAERSAQLLEIAEEVISQRGVQATSMEEIAERAGVTKPVVYDHFGSKDGLVAAVVELAGRQLHDEVTAAVEAAEHPGDALAAGLGAYQSFMAARRESWQSLLSGTVATSESAAAMERVRALLGDLVADLVAADIPGCSPALARTYAQIVLGASERLATAPGDVESAAPAVLTRALMDVLWCGFATVRDGGGWPGGDGAA